MDGVHLFMTVSPSRSPIFALDRPWAALFPASRSHLLKSLACGLGFVAASVSFQSAHAATVPKANNFDNLDLATSWTGGVAPTSADIATWDATVTAANTSTLNNTVTWGGIKIGSLTTGNPGGNVGININAGKTLTILAGGGIDLTDATVDLAIGGTGFLRLGTTGATDTWTVPTGRTLTVGANITTGGGTVTFNVTGGGSTFFNGPLSNAASPLNLNNTGAGTVTLGGSATSSVTSLSATSNGGKTIVNGATVNVGSLSTYGGSTAASTFELQSGAASFNGGIRTSTGDASLIKVSGGTFSAASVQLQRNQSYTTLPTAASSTSGFVVTGGAATITGILDIGTSISSASALVSGGSLTVNGGTRIANNGSTGTGRYSVLQVSGGAFTSTNTTEGIVLSANTTNATNSELLLTGGTTTAEIINFGLTTTPAGATGTLALNGASAALYLGSGGMVQGPASYTSTINLTAGTLGAKDNWASALNMNLAGDSVTIKAADATDVAKNITLSGALSGANGFSKTGGGTLTLSGSNFYFGPTNVNAGKLFVSGSIGGSVVNVNSGGTLGGTGATDIITLNAGGAIEAGSTTDDLTSTSLTWNGETSGAFAQMKFELGTGNNTSDRLTLTGSLSKGTGSTFRFDFLGGGAASTSYTLLTFGSQSGFNAGDFTFTNLAAGLSGSFALQNNALVFSVIPEPASAALLLGGMVGLFGSRRIRRRSI